MTNGSAGFLLVDGAEEAEPIYRVELETGALELLVEGFDTDTDQFFRPALVLGGDRVYRLTRSGEVMSVELDGSGLQTEPFMPETLGATLHGLYYTSTEWSDGSVDVCSLWYRGAGDTTFRSLLESEYCSILSSSRSALVAERDTEAGTEIVLAKGAELVPLGPAPTEPVDVLAVGDEAVFLLHSEETPSGYELLWLSAEQEPSRIPIDLPVDGAALALAPGGVALMLVEGTHTFVRTYTRTGAEPLRIGVLNSSLLLHVDGYVWYLWYPVEDFQPRLRRARQLELIDLRPEE